MRQDPIAFAVAHGAESSLSEEERGRLALAGRLGYTIQLRPRAAWPLSLVLTGAAFIVRKERAFQKRCTTVFETLRAVQKMALADVGAAFAVAEAADIEFFPPAELANVNGDTAGLLADDILALINDRLCHMGDDQLKDALTIALARVALHQANRRGLSRSRSELMAELTTALDHRTRTEIAQGLVDLPERSGLSAELSELFK